VAGIIWPPRQRLGRRGRCGVAAPRRRASRTLKMIIVAVVRVVCLREGVKAVEGTSGEVVREAKPWRRQVGENLLVGSQIEK
jgi:hypothetical protein